MKRNDPATPFSNKQRDFLDELIESAGTDEMGLLDLIFAEEILNQGEQAESA